MPDWNEDLALRALAVERVPFQEINGNIQGYAMPGRKLAINRVAAMPAKTLFHEFSHIVIGQCDESGFSESELLGVVSEKLFSNQIWIAPSCPNLSRIS